MTRLRRACATAAALAIGIVASACSGDDPGRDAEAGDAETGDGDDPVLGTFVGKVPGTDAFVAVVAGPDSEGEGAGQVQVYLADGQGLSEWFSGHIDDSTFVAASDDGTAKSEGELRADAVTGTVELPDRGTVEYEATPPSGAAGLYDLTVSADGQLSGVSAAGLGVSGEIVPPGETGALNLVDGTRWELVVTEKAAGDLAHLRPGQVRLILLPEGELRGAGKRTASEDGASSLFLRSAAPPPG